MQTNSVFDLVSLDCRLRLLENFFWIAFQKKRLYLSSSCFSNVFNASARLFCPLSFAQSRKILSKFSKLSAILKHGEKNFVTITSIARISFNRSQARTNQNARITWVIRYRVFNNNLLTSSLQSFSLRVLKWRKVLRIQTIFYVAGQKIRDKKVLPRHWTGAASQETKDKAVSFRK